MSLNEPAGNLPEQLAAISRLTDGHLLALEAFRSSMFPGRPLDEWGSQPVSLPGFRRRIRQSARLLAEPHPSRPSSPKDLLSRDDLPRVASTCSVVRSIIRNPGLPFRNLRPLHLLVFLRRALANGEIGPAVLSLSLNDNGERERLVKIDQAKNFFALGQLAVTVEALFDALPDPLDNESPSRPLTDAEIIAEALYLLQSNSEVSAGDAWTNDQWSKFKYSLERLMAIDFMLEFGPRPSDANDHSGLLRVLSDIEAAVADDVTSATRRELAECCRDAVWSCYTLGDPGDARFEPLVTWLSGLIGKALEDGAFRHGTPVEGEEHRVSRAMCIDIIRTVSSDLMEQSDAFCELELGIFGSPHPYTLHWLLEGLEACARAMRRCGPSSDADADWGTADQIRKIEQKVARLVKSARVDSERSILEAATATQTVDYFRLGYHLIVSIQHRDGVAGEALVRGLEHLAAGLWSGQWPKRDRAFLTRHGEHYGFTPAMVSALITAVSSHPSGHMFEQPLESIVVQVLDHLERCAVRGEVDHPALWATALDSYSLEPEAWATGEVYSMLYLAQAFLGSIYARRTIGRYAGRLPSHRGVPWRPVDKRSSPLYRLMDGDIWSDSPWERPGKRVGETLAENVCLPLLSKHSFFSEYDISGRSDAGEFLRSGVLFGPPGTGKTTFVESLADFLGWPLVSLSPSDFLESGREGVAKVARDVFHQLMSLRDAVVFLDEMEELVRHREQFGDKEDIHAVTAPPSLDRAGVVEWHLDRVVAQSGAADAPDVLQKLWTTTFLTLLQELHDEASVVFLMATNHFTRIDPAIVRAGRFDFRLHLLPPSPARKLELLPDLIHDYFGGRISVSRASDVVVQLREVVHLDLADLSELSTTGPVLSPFGDQVDAVPQPVRFAFFTWADVRRLGRDLGSRLLAQADPGAGTPSGLMAHDLVDALNGVVPVGFHFNPRTPSEATHGLSTSFESVFDDVGKG